MSCEVVVSRLVLEMMKVHLHWRDNQAGHGWNKQRQTEKGEFIVLKQGDKFEKLENLAILFVHACVCVCVCVCVLTCVRRGHVTAWMRRACLHVCLGVFAVFARPAAARAPNGGEEFENLPPALTFQPPACQSCYV